MVDSKFTIEYCADEVFTGNHST